MSDFIITGPAKLFIFRANRRILWNGQPWQVRQGQIRKFVFCARNKHPLPTKGTYLGETVILPARRRITDADWRKWGPRLN